MPDEDVVLTASFIADKSGLQELIGLCELLAADDYTGKAGRVLQRPWQLPGKYWQMKRLMQPK